MATARKRITEDGAVVEMMDRRRLRVFLERRRMTESGRLGEVRLEEALTDGLRRTLEQIPAATAAIVLDNPITKRRDKRENDLVVIATHTPAGGSSANYPVGRVIQAYGNRVGDVYISGEPFNGASDDDGERTSLLAVPVTIEDDVCGVLIVRNRLGASSFNDRETKLMQVFADYMSSVIVNILDAERAREMSVRDGLTGLFNDRYFHAQLSKEIVLAEDSGEDLSLAFLDLDHFKQVNDNHGHLAGSMVLKEIGQILKNVVNDPAATLTRYGGDEFVLVFPNYDAEAARETCERLRRTIEDYCFLRMEGPYGPPLRIQGVISCSIGIASYHQHVRKRFSLEQNKDAFLKVADAAMYQAKEKGKNRVIVAEREPTEEVS